MLLQRTQSYFLNLSVFENIFKNNQQVVRNFEIFRSRVFGTTTKINLNIISKSPKNNVGL